MLPSTPQNAKTELTPVTPALPHIPSDASSVSDSSSLSSLSGGQTGSGLTDLLENDCANAITGSVELAGPGKPAVGGLARSRQWLDLTDKLVENSHLSYTKLAALSAVCRHLFQGDQALTKTQISTMGDTVRSRYYIAKNQCSNLIASSGFISFYLVLTIYALFGPDVAILHAQPQDDYGISVFNTVVLMFFLVELLLMSWCLEGYVCRGVFWLDFLACISLLGDTSIVKELLESDAVVAGKGSRAARMARMASRSSRLTRLTRAARVARISRIVPRISRMLSEGVGVLARVLLRRRLWRIFRFLDEDRDGLVTENDVTVCKATLLSGFVNKRPSKMEGAEREAFKQVRSFVKKTADMIKLPVERVSSQEKMKDDIEKAKSSKEGVSFSEFAQKLLEGAAGKYLKDACISDIDKGGGFWNVTHKITERTAVKVCVGVIVLLITLPFLEVDLTDRSMQSGLMQVQGILESEFRNNPVDYVHVCEQVNTYAQSSNYAGHLLYLVVDRRVVWDDWQRRCVGDSAPQDFDTEKRIKIFNDVQRRANLRTQEMLLVCPSSMHCVDDEQSAAAFAIFDVKTQFHSDTERSILMTVTVIVLILTFVYFFNSETSKISKQFLKPLRVLSDDMSAMSLIHLVYSDEDCPDDGQADLGEPFEEMSVLQQSFEQLRGALRSWSKFVPPAVALRLFSAGVEAQVGVTRVAVTILFCDINGFDDTVQLLKPKDLLQYLSKVLDLVGVVIERNGGTLLEFIGDEVLAVFNQPDELQEHAKYGVLSALQLHKRVSETRSQLMRFSLQSKVPPLSLRCGVHTANMLCGNIGSHRRMKYGLLGDGVNLCARIKGLNTRYCSQTLISENCLKAMNFPEEFYARPVDLVVVKGRSRSTRVYEVLGRVPVQEKSEGKSPLNTIPDHSESPQKLSNGIEPSAPGEVHSPRQSPRKTPKSAKKFDTNQSVKSSASKRSQRSCKSDASLTNTFGANCEEIVKRHTNAFEHYLARRFNEALGELRRVSALAENEVDVTLMGALSPPRPGFKDEPSRMLIARCIAYALDPPPPDWDGAERLTQKTWAAEADQKTCDRDPKVSEGIRDDKAPSIERKTPPPVGGASFVTVA